MPEPIVPEEQTPSTPSTPSEPTPEPSPQEAVARAFDSITKAAEAPAGPTGEPPEETPEAKRARDEAGRFAKEEKKPKEPGAPPEPEARAKAGEVPTAPAASPAKPVAEEVPPDPTERAPQAWKAVERELWAKVPPELRPALLRREAEVNKRLQDLHVARQVAESVEAVWKPHEAMLRMTGRSPLETTKFLFETAAALQSAPDWGRAQAMAHAIRNYRVNVEMLAQALDGLEQPVAPGAPRGVAQPPAQFRDPRVDEMIAREQRESLAAVRAQYDEFRKDHEFFDDVREQMADIVVLKKQQGLDISDDDAYALAVAMDPELTGIIRQREEAKRAATSPEATQRAQQAAASLRSSGGDTPRRAPAEGGNPRDPTADVRAAWEQAEGQQRRA